MAASCWVRFKLLWSILMCAWGNASTLVNAVTLLRAGHALFAYLSLFFLVLPGVVTAVGFLVLHFAGIGKLGAERGSKIILYAVLLLLFYPVVPIVLCSYSLITGRRVQLAALSRLFEGFLDDGPQFVIRVVVVVLYKIGLGTDKGDIIFIMSMVTAFLSMLHRGLKFNERTTFMASKLLVALPMLAAFAGARAFTLAVFVKETIGTKEWIGAAFVILAFAVINIASFKLCKQDWTRSVVFGLCSMLIPAGYNNDTYFFQRPHQPVAEADSEAAVGRTSPNRKEDRGRRRVTIRTILDDDKGEDPVDELVEAEQLHSSSSPSTPLFGRMLSGRFLLLYTLGNTALLAACSIYLSATRNLDEDSHDALAIPQIFAIIPGILFALSRSMLLPDLKPRCCPSPAWATAGAVLCALLAIAAYISLVPSLFWTLIYKIAQ